MPTALLLLAQDTRHVNTTIRGGRLKKEKKIISWKPPSSLIPRIRFYVEAIYY